MARDGAQGDVTTRLRLVLDDTTGRRVYRETLHGSPAVAPDGRAVAYAVAEGDTVVLRVQRLDRFDPWVVDGGGRMPFFSPDGRWIGFLRGGEVWKVPAEGGAPTRLGSLDEHAFSWDVVTPGVWLPEGDIHFTGPRGLVVVPANGGSTRTVAVGDSAGGGEPLFDLSRAPDGRLLAQVSRDGRARLALLSTDGRDVRLLPDDVRPPAGFVGDLLVFARAGQRYASAFDPAALRPVGEPLTLTDLPPVSYEVAAWLRLAASTAWVEGTSAPRVEPVWVDRAGAATPVGVAATRIRWPRLSPDGRRLALAVTGDQQLVVDDLAAGTRTRLQAPAGRTEPVWFHDGTRLVTSKGWGTSRNALVVQRADGSRAPDTLLTSGRDLWPTDVSPGDSLLLFYGATEGDPQDVQALHLRTRQLHRLALPGEQRGARFSPDMRWVALQSREGGGRYDVLVVPWPSLDARHVVSTDGGGEEPIWSRDGRELFYRRGGRVMVVRVTPGEAWTASPPAELFGGSFEADQYGDQSWDIAPDGRFLMLRAVGQPRLEIRVIQHWAAELARRLADGAQR